MQYVPVLDKNNKPLMPCHPARARQMVRDGKAVRRWFRGVYAIKLVAREDGNTQPIACGVDQGSKKEAFTVKSAGRTFLNIQTDAVGHVKDAMQTRREMRKGRRSRKTPCRKNRQNRSRGGIPPSTFARWNFKLNVLKWLGKIFPINTVVVEDIKARSKPGKRGWNSSFTPLMAGKTWFYDQIKSALQVNLICKSGYETSEERKRLILEKSKQKLSNDFSAHCVDSWVLANFVSGKQVIPENKSIHFVTPLRFHRRQLHALQPTKGGYRRSYGSTRSLGFKRGSLVKHPKYSLCYVGGSAKNQISLHSLSKGSRLCQNAKLKDVEFLTYNPWRYMTSSSA